MKIIIASTRFAPASRRAFTLVELLVAIGVISFLVVGIGQVFQSVGGLVSIGTASAEVEQMARSIERQMRDDFRSLSAMDSADTFIAIRMRELGDVNRNGVCDNCGAPDGETAVYLTSDDRDADNRDIADGVIDGPYDKTSRAVTVRLDEIMFLGQPILGNYTSFESGRNARPPAQAPAALISYGQSLRPPRDPNWPPDNPNQNSPRIPQRIFIPDGDFGVRQGDDNRFQKDLTSLYPNSSAFDKATGRNEYAGSWILSRQALLLAGGAAAGNDLSPFGVTTFGNEREYAPFIRDITTIDRFWSTAGGGLGALGFGLDHQGPRSGRYDARSVNRIVPPAPRLIQHGRVDICAQNITDVKRWLQGEPWPSSGVTPPPLRLQKSSPFDAGRFDSSASFDAYENDMNGIDLNDFGDLASTAPTDPGSVRSQLWQRPDPSVNNPDQLYYATRTGIRSAIAGVFTRLIAEDEPPYIDRNRNTTGINYPINNFQDPSDTEDAYMDSHAVLTSQCSNFEVAWRLADPDWPKAEEDLDIDGDGSFEYRTGDRIWFDITPQDPNATTQSTVDRSRSTVQNWLSNLIIPSARQKLGDISFGALPANPGSLPDGAANHQPELGYQDWHNVVSASYGFRLRDTVPNTPSGTNMGVPANVGYPSIYNPDISMGAPKGQKEYLAIWPFHAPTLNGGYESDAFPKKLQIRIRMTLHDTQHRIKGGKKFEFIFDVSPGG